MYEHACVVYTIFYMYHPRGYIYMLYRGNLNEDRAITDARLKGRSNYYMFR